MMNKFILSLDIDWAPDHILFETFEILQQYKIKVILFATHLSPIIKSLDNEKYEIGIHPDFTDSKDLGDTIRKLKIFYPDSVSLRSHSLATSGKITANYEKYNIKYVSNYMMFLKEDIKPVKQLGNYTEYPIFFMDDVNLSWPLQNKFSINTLHLESTGYKIFDFHPIHVYLNTKEMKQYLRAKKYINDMNGLKRFKNNVEAGTRTLFVEILEYIKENNITTYHFNELDDGLRDK